METTGAYSRFAAFSSSSAIRTVAGVLVHYDDPGSRDLYFTDPKWLYHVISRVAASKALVTNCTMDTGALGRVLALPEEFTQQVLR